jgi:hypothetical protein
MSINPLNDISRVYLEQVAIKEAVDQDTDGDTDFADVRIARMIASGVPREVAIQKTRNKPYNKKIKSVRESLIGKQSEIDANKNGKIDSQDFTILRSTKKKKQVKEGFSNWREDLIEIVDKIPKNKSEDVRITDKKVDNKIDINPRLDLGEAVESLGGTLIEMIEIDEVDYIVESVYEELLGEGYEEDDIEEALEYALVEAKVTFGHDTSETKKKKGRNLLGAVGRLARQKLSSKYRGAKKAVSSAAVSGLRNVARGALGAARKLEGDKKPSPVHSRAGTRSPSVHRGAGVGQRERVSSGSYSAPKPEAPKPEQRKASTPVSDPWEGSYTSRSPKPSPKPQAKTTTVSPKPLSKEQETAVKRAQRKNPNLSGEDARRIAASVSSKEDRQAETRRRMDRAGARIGVSEDYWSTVAKAYKEKYELLEKAESEQQQKLFGLALSVKRGQTSRDKVSDRVLEIVDSMSEKKIRDFAKTPHKGLPHKIETKEEAIRQEFIARMVSKIEEQSGVYVDEEKLPSSMKKGKKTRESKLLKLTDCDDCTHNQSDPNAAKIHVLRPVTEEKKRKQQFKKVETLTPQQFAHHNLTPGDEYGFDEFKSTELVKKTTKPNKRIVNFLNREDFSMIDERIRRYPVVRGVTARGSMDDNRGFTQDMKSRIGVKNLKSVHFVGDIKKGSGPEKKATTATHIVKKNPDAKEVHFVDDHSGNVKAVTDTLAKSGKTVKGKVGRTRETGPKIKGFVAKPATKEKGTVKVGEVVPVRLGGEGRGGNRGIRSNTSPSKSPQETQKRRKQQKMREAVDVNMQQQDTPQVNTSTPNQLTAKQKSTLSKLVQSKTMELAAAKRAITSGISPDIG